jgi:hypothetical protein
MGNSDGDLGAAERFDGRCSETLLPWGQPERSGVAHQTRPLWTVLVERQTARRLAGARSRAQKTFLAEDGRRRRAEPGREETGRKRGRRPRCRWLWLWGLRSEARALCRRASPIRSKGKSQVVSLEDSRGRNHIGGKTRLGQRNGKDEGRLTIGQYAHLTARPPPAAAAAARLAADEPFGSRFRLSRTTVWPHLSMTAGLPAADPACCEGVVVLGPGEGR